MSATIRCFCSCALFSNIYREINCLAKNGSDLCNFYTRSCSKLDFWKCFIKTFCLLFFTDFKSLMFHNNIVKISEILNE